MHSQNNEEQVIADYFAGFTGKALDIGACDGVTFSNTRALIERGWGGLMVEANPVKCAELCKLYADKADVQVVSALVMPKERGLKNFFWTCEALGTIDHAVMARFPESPWRHMFAACVALDDIEGLGKWEFISIDADGVSVDLAVALSDATLSAARMICVEHDKRQPELEARFAPFGFRLAIENPENQIYIK